jgi:hypothetical protein
MTDWWETQSYCVLSPLISWSPDAPNQRRSEMSRWRGEIEKKIYRRLAVGRNSEEGNGRRNVRFLLPPNLGK